MSKLVLSPPVASPFRFSVGLTRAAPCKTQPSGVNGSRKLTSCRQGGFLPHRGQYSVAVDIRDRFAAEIYVSVVQMNARLDKTACWEATV